LGILLSAMVVFPGLTPTKALSAMGIVSIAIGFAFKDIFENFFAGILLLWRFPFENGDFVECQEVMGQVEHISVRMTQVRHPSGELVVLPNSFLFKNPVRVLTARDKRRATITAGVAYGENVGDAVDVIQRAVKECESVSGVHPVQVFPKAFGESSIDIEVAWWSDPTPLGVRRSRGEVITAIKRELDAAGIEIPFPYRTLTANTPIRFSLVDGKTDGVDENKDA
ncbi:MAG: mechanosensitive ion channel family protein, partial [Desulfosarcina sp.]